jgi:hypothetical protein
MQRTKSTAWVDMQSGIAKSEVSGVEAVGAMMRMMTTNTIRRMAGSKTSDLGGVIVKVGARAVRLGQRR